VVTSECVCARAHVFIYSLICDRAQSLHAVYTHSNPYPLSKASSQPALSRGSEVRVRCLRVLSWGVCVDVTMCDRLVCTPTYSLMRGLLCVACSHATTGHTVRHSSVGGAYDETNTYNGDVCTRRCAVRCVIVLRSSPAGVGTKATRALNSSNVARVVTVSSLVSRFVFFLLTAKDAAACQATDEES
jgi:hypothetical protein